MLNLSDYIINNLPLIEKSLPDYLRRNKYRNLYLKILFRCLNMTKDELNCYTEKHHAIPKCMGGTDSKEDNIIIMPIRYHIMAHIILSEAYPDNYGVVNTVFIITTKTESISKIVKDSKSEAISKFSTRFLARLREDAAEKISGKNNPMYGKTRDPEIMKKFLDAAHTPEAWKKISEKMKGENNPMYGKKGPLHHNYGKKANPESIRKAVENHTYYYGEDNVRSKKVIGPDGTVYVSVTEASAKTGIPLVTLERWIHKRVKTSKTKDWDKWKFLED